MLFLEKKTIINGVYRKYNEEEVKMKKVISSLLVACLLFITTVSSVSAVGSLNDNEKEVLTALKTVVTVDGAKIKLQASDINTAENYMMQDGFDLTTEQKNIIINNIEATKAYLQANHIKDFSSITRQQAYDILEFLQAAANAIGLTVKLNAADRTISFYDSDKLVYTTTQVIKKTGYDITQTAVIASGLVIILIGAGYYAKRKHLLSK